MSATDNITFVKRIQTAVYWAPTGAFTQYGVPVLDDPIEISCRWEDQSVETIAPDGTTKMSVALVYPDRDVEVAGVLMLGDLESSTDLINPKENDGAEEIIRFDKLPDFNGTKFLRTAFI